MPALRFRFDVQFVIRVGFLHAMNYAFVGAFAADRFYLVYAVELDFELKHLVGFKCFYLVAVYEECYFFPVGINLDFRFASRAVCKSFARDMHERFVRPVRLVNIEAVLFSLSVEGYEPFVVHTGFAALIARVSREVERVPDVGAPNIGVTREAFKHIFVISRLIFFRVVSAFGVFGVQIRHCFRAVFRIP